MTEPEYFGEPPGVSAPNIWGIAEMRSLLSLPDVYSGAFYACKLAQTRGRRPRRVTSNILSIKDVFFHGPPLVLTKGAKTKYIGPLPSHCGCNEPHDESLPDARFQNFVSSGFSSLVLQGIFQILQDLSLRVGVSETLWRGKSSNGLPSASTGASGVGSCGLSGSSFSGTRFSDSPTSSSFAATSGVSGTL